MSVAVENKSDREFKDWLEGFFGLAFGVPTVANEMAQVMATVEGVECTPEYVVDYVMQPKQVQQRVVGRSAWDRKKRVLGSDNEWLPELERKYGLTEESHYEILKKQRGVCAVCRQPHVDAKGNPARLFVDHDHETGEVRGLLCHSCNIGIGGLKDNPEVMRRAARYVSKNKATVTA